jgi:hypothetical protein
VAAIINVLLASVLAVALPGPRASLHGFTQARAEQTDAADALGDPSGQPLGGSIKDTVRAVSPVALLSKVVLDVARREASRDWQSARRGDILSPGDKVKTGEKSVAVIKFRDRSLVRVRERSELTVNETTSGVCVSRSVNLEDGSVGFKTEKQGSDEEFRFTSPTSVASIRGTEGQFISGRDSDTLIIIEGVVLLKNARSFETVEVQAGHTGIANSDGTVFVRQATLTEITKARGAVREDGEMMHAPAAEGQGGTVAPGVSL